MRALEQTAAGNESAICEAYRRQSNFAAALRHSPRRRSRASGSAALAPQPRQRLDPAVYVTRRGIHRSGAAHFAQRRYIARNYGSPACHRFDNGQPKPFAIGRKHDDRGAPIERGKLRAFQKRQLHQRVDQVETFGELLLVSRQRSTDAHEPGLWMRCGGPC